MHRDLKPENILVRRDMVPKIADFGLSRMVGMMEFCQTVAGTPGYMAPEVMSGAVPYDFPADTYSLGLILKDMLSDKTCLEWYIAGRPACDHERFLKRWPAGATPGKKTTAIVELQNKAICQAPGERITAYQLCADLLELEDKDPMPCKLWQVRTKMPPAPPMKRMVSPVFAAEIAGRLGYAKGTSVFVQVDGQMREGKVEHISTTLCPGAAQVRYKSDQGEKTTLVCPWEFATTLRPSMREPLSCERSKITNPGEDVEPGKAKPKGKARRSSRGATTAAIRQKDRSLSSVTEALGQIAAKRNAIKCKTVNCSIQ
jgi:serine/threonine protein kinase